MIEAAAKSGAKGIVSAGTGAVRPTHAEDATFDKCFKETGMLMCLCSRVASGRVVRSPGLQQRMNDTYTNPASAPLPQPVFIRVAAGNGVIGTHRTLRELRFRFDQPNYPLSLNRNISSGAIMAANEPFPLHE